MDYTQLTDSDRARMRSVIGISRDEELFGAVRPQSRLERGLKIPSALSEPELLAQLRQRMSANRLDTCFQGGGAYDHFIPAVVDHIASQSAFVTAYTPYQAEASQGALQAFFEYQTMVCQLTGMDVSNASLYEGASALAEAVIMAAAATGKRQLVVSGGVHPEYLQTLQTYLNHLPLKTRMVPVPGGVTNVDSLIEMIGNDTAAVVMQCPNFFGIVEQMDKLADVSTQTGALLVVVVDPISLATLKRPGSYGADIVVAEGQPLGMPLSFGGPYLGVLACREKFVRKMPGRLVAEGKDGNQQRAFCLAMQTREQHIKRERATSNVCTNQGLLALRAAIYVAAMGPRGLGQVAQLCLNKAHYAAKRIGELPGYNLKFDAPFFKEFVVESRKPVDHVLEHCTRCNISAGVPLGQFDPSLSDCFMVAVTEQRTKAEIDGLVAALAEA